MKKLFAFTVATCLALTGAIVHADDTYPQQTIRLVVPASPGGGADSIARLVSPGLSASLGQPVVVDNKAGASGTIAGNLVAKSKPNGYTLLMAQSTSIVIAPHIYEQLSYNTLKDLVPVTQVIRVPNILVVNPQLPAKTVAEFIALAKAKPGALNFGSAGIGSPSHVAGEMFDKQTNIQMMHVPYQGSGPAVIALLANQIQAMFAPISAVLPLIKSNKLRALGVTTIMRQTALPDIPTIAESGVPGFDINSWFGVFVPAGTPPEIIARLNRDIVQVLKDPRVVSAIAQQASQPVGNSPQEFSTLVRNENQQFAALIKEIGAQTMR
ncbi:Tripartite tricarboxylate transporter family receptor [compost metagenome]